MLYIDIYIVYIFFILTPLSHFHTTNATASEHFCFFCQNLSSALWDLIDMGYLIPTRHKYAIIRRLFLSPTAGSARC